MRFLVKGVKNHVSETHTQYASSSADPGSRSTSYSVHIYTLSVFKIDGFDSLRHSYRSKLTLIDRVIKDI